MNIGMSALPFVLIYDFICYFGIKVGLMANDKTSFYA